jgi:DNA-binding MarR family transcriptional regulator
MDHLSAAVSSGRVTFSRSPPQLMRIKMPGKQLASHQIPLHFKRRMSDDSRSFTDEEYARLADFRYAVRHYLDFSANAAKSQGLTPQQHQALLVIRGSEGASANVGRLAERLCLRHHTAVGLAQRLETAGLIIRKQSEQDRRSVLLTLTTEGEAKLEILSQVHRRELRQIGPRMRALFRELTGEVDA